MPRSRITLPTLLAQLPAVGEGSLVQPAAWAERFPNSFYKITRTNVRVKPAEGTGETQYLSRAGSASTLSGAVDSKGKAREEESEDLNENAFEDDMEIGDVSSDVGSSVAGSSSSSLDLAGKRAHGQAWGILFWNGQPKFPFRQNWVEAESSTFVPQSKIRRALSDSWKAVDESSLKPETRELVRKLESGKRRDWLARREKVKVENLSVKDLKGLEAWRKKQEQQV